MSEGAGTLELVLVLSKAAGQAVSVFVITMNGSARGLLNLICPLTFQFSC